MTKTKTDRNFGVVKTNPKLGLKVPYPAPKSILKKPGLKLRLDVPESAGDFVSRVRQLHSQQNKRVRQPIEVTAQHPSIFEEEPVD